VATDLRFFDLIVPCGIAGRTATSLEKVLGGRVDRDKVAPLVTKHFGKVFGLEMKLRSREGLMDALQRLPVEVPA
jgi:lipoate-protein ligase B